MSFKETDTINTTAYVTKVPYTPEPLLIWGLNNGEVEYVMETELKELDCLDRFIVFIIKKSLLELSEDKRQAVIKELNGKIVEALNKYNKIR